MPGAVAAGTPAPAAAPRPGLFSLEGRAVPALYLVGWVASLLGGGVLFISFAATVPGASGWLFLVGTALLGVGLIAVAGSQAIERGRRPELAYRGPSPVLAFLVVVCLTFVALIAILAPLSALGLDARSPVATTLNLLITTALYLGVIRLLVVGPGSLSWRDMGVVRPGATQLVDLVVGAAFALPVLVVTIALGLVLSRFLAPAPPVLPESSDIGGLLANLLSAAILAPVGEEIFFRGFATTAWARSSGARSAIVRGALFFAVAHVVTLVDASFAEGAQRALYSFVALLPVSVALGWLFLARRSLYAAIGLHAAFNGIQVLLLVAASATA
ncbi:MAG TPA: type II CAAX endopeptidase family protein [Candidatus Limnocylindrales bacterium]|nr:type II CAAX endopeptidase family protein [Candidatus Limnocylindrales bacterium]